MEKSNQNELVTKIKNFFNQCKTFELNNDQVEKIRIKINEGCNIIEFLTQTYKLSTIDIKFLQPQLKMEVQDLKDYSQNSFFKKEDAQQIYNISHQQYLNKRCQTTLSNEQNLDFNIQLLPFDLQDNNQNQKTDFKSQRFEFNLNSFQNVQQEQKPKIFQSEQGYTFNQFNKKDIELVLFDQIKDQYLDQSPMKIICNQEQIKELLNINDSLTSSQQLTIKQQLRVIGFYGNYSLSIKLINQLFPALQLKRYFANQDHFYPQYDQIVAFSLREQTQQNQNEHKEKIVQRTIILVYKENQNCFQDFIHQNEDSLQLIRYMLDVCHIFVNVLPNSSLQNWGAPQFYKGYNQDSDNIISFDNQFKYQQDIQFKLQDLIQNLNNKRGDDVIPYFNVIKQISQHSIETNQWILTQQFEDKTALIAIRNKENYIFNQNKIKNIKTKFKNSSFDYFKSANCIQQSKISQTEKIQKILEVFSTFMQNVKEEFTFSSTILENIKKIEGKERIDIKQIQRDVEKSENIQTSEYAQELFEELKNNFKFNNCCKKRNKNCSKNNCVSILQIIQQGISQIKSNEIMIIQDNVDFDQHLKKSNPKTNQEWIDSLQIFLVESQYNQIILNSLIDQLYQIIKLNNQDLMIDEKQRENLFNTIFQKVINVCQTISKKLTQQNQQISQICQISNNLMEQICNELDKFSSIKLNQIHLNLHQINFSNEYSDGIDVFPDKIILSPSIKKVEKYFYYNEQFDYIVAHTHDSINLSDHKLFYKLQDYPITQIWRFNKTQKNDQLTLIQNLQPGRVVEISSLTKNWLIFNLEEKQYEIGQIDQYGRFSNGKQFDLNMIIQKQLEQNQDEDLVIKNAKRIFIQQNLIYIFDYEMNYIFRIEDNNKITKLSYKNNSNILNYDEFEEIEEIEDYKQDQIEDVVLVQQKDEFLFALIFKENIKFTNENLIDQKINIKIPFPEMNLNDIKIFTFQNFIKILLYRKDKSIEVLYQPNPVKQQSSFQNMNLQNLQDDKGNIMIDKLAFSLDEFGPRGTDSFIVKQSKIFFYAEDSKFQSQIKQYIEHKQFKNIFKNFFTDISQQFEEQTSQLQQIIDSLNKIGKNDRYSEKQLEFCLKTRVPIQISTFKDFEYLSLKNGIHDLLSQQFNSQSKIQTSIYENKKKLEFGCYDDLINEIPQNKTLILSIYGQQSVGKSSQLNRLFSSRFGVSAARCTDGIWMSLCWLKEDIYIILLDCEGIYSSKRSEEEEKTLMQQISMVSDISIMFNGLNSINKGYKQILENLKKVSQFKDKDTEYYQGDLIILTRDVDTQNQKRQIEQELKSELNDSLQYLKNVSLLYLYSFQNQEFYYKLMEVKQEIIKKLQNKINSQPNHLNDSNYDKSQNNNQIQNKSNFDQDFIGNKEETPEYQIIEGNNTDEQFQFQHSFKQTYIKKQNIKLDLIKYSFCQLQLNDKQNIRQILYAEQIDNLKQYFKNQMHNFEFDGLHHTFSEKLYDYEKKQYELTIDQKSFKFNEYKESDLLEDRFNPNIKQFINFICEQQNIQVNCLQVSSLQNIRPIVQQISKRTVEDRQRILFQFTQRQIDNRKENRVLNDQLQNCNQQVVDNIMATITLCDQKCKCGDECIRCKNHLKEHYCGRIHIDEKKMNLCEKECFEHSFCKRLCSKDIGHEGEHKCIDQTCHNKCILCQKQCQFLRGHQESIHICDQEHNCQSICEQEGYCEIQYKTINKVYKPQNKQEFKYQQHNQKGNKLACSKIIPTGKDRHEGNHVCSQIKHQCKNTCPECKCFCEKQIDHEGEHFSQKHRNLQSNLGIFQNKRESIIINDIAQADISILHSSEELNSLLKSQQQKRTYIDGDKVKPEICEEQCKRLGRGHTHFIKCQGNEFCLEIKHGSENVRHSQEIRNNIEFDEVKCHQFWKLYNWSAPLKQKDQLNYTMSNKCNWGCSHKTHLNKQNYCKENLWHQGPHNIEFNKNDCKHSPPNNIIDLCFTVDTTGSMQWAVDQVKEVVSYLISSFDIEHKDYDLKVTFVGYRDHQPQAMEYTTKIYSNLVKPQEIYPIIDKITVNEGGDTPEAVIDGLLETAQNINWRDKSTRYVFHIFDAPPHGYKQYGYESKSWNDGCFCQKTIKDVTKEFKSRDLKYYMIQCSSILEQTRQVFEKEFQNLFQTHLLIVKGKKQDYSQLHTKLENVIAKQIMSTDYFFYQVKNNK